MSLRGFALQRSGAHALAGTEGHLASPTGFEPVSPP
jgi:hypothetical protein